MTKDEIELLIEGLRLSAREIKNRRQQREYLEDLRKYHKRLLEKYSLDDKVSS